MSGFDVGRFRVGSLDVDFVNEYMHAVDDCRGQLAEFPDLIMTFDGHTGAPVVSAHLEVGRLVTVLTAQRSALQLSVTMGMEELMDPVDALLSSSLPEGC